MTAFTRYAILPALLLLACTARAQEGPQADATPAWNQAEIVFVGQLTDARTGPVASSMPPIYSNRLQFDVVKVLRGSLAGKTVACSHSYRAVDNFPYQVGQKYLVALSAAQGRTSVRELRLADDAAMKEVELACALPLGWTLAGGKAVSPWAALGKSAWSAELAADVAPDVEKPKLACDTTGRPALLAGPKVEWTVEAVPPKKLMEWTNPDGDGEYKLTVTNPTAEPLAVPALLTQDGKILWLASVVIVCEKKPYTCPGCKPVTGKVASMVLKPKESVTATLNALALSGPDWPRGGSRVEFTFCLGERARTMSFYYMSRYHDGLRDAAIKAIGQ